MRLVLDCICPDRPIFSHVILSPPSSIPGHSHIPSDVPVTDYTPRFRVPFRYEKYRYHLFSAGVDERLAATSETFLPDISSDTDFECQYSAITDALLSSAKAFFRFPTPSPQSRKITNPTIKLIVTETQHINCLLSVLSHSHAHTLPQFPPAILGE